MRGYRNDYTSGARILNIDTVFDMLNEAKTSAGLDSFIKESEMDYRGKKIRKHSIYKKDDEEDKKEELPCKKTCNKNRYDEDGKFNWEYSGDENEDYICEYCRSLDYTNKYKPEICDDCEECSTCSEYNSGECSGCSYSTYRDGGYYHEKLKTEELLSENDINLLKNIEQGNSEERNDIRNFNFTVLDI